MSEHSLKCSYDGLLLYETRLCSLASHLQLHLHITDVQSSLCKVETVTRLLKFFLHLCQSVYDERPVLKPILVVKIEIIPWCLIFSNLSTPVHLYYCPQIKSIHVFKRANNSGQIGLIVKMKMQD